MDAFLESVASFPIVEGETTVHFLYHGDAEDMAIVGDIIEGRHQEPMRRLSGTRLFYYTVEVAPDAAIKYQFVKDFEETVLDERNPNRVEAVLFGLEEYSWLKMPGRACLLPFWPFFLIEGRFFSNAFAASLKAVGSTTIPQSCW